MSNPQLFQVTQAAIIKSPKGEILLLQAHNDKWMLPGGRIDEGESWLEGLKRELKEEANIDEFTIEGIVDVDSYYSEFGPKYAVTFMVDVPNLENIKISDEHKDHLWVVPTEENLNSYEWWYEGIKERVKKALHKYQAF